MSLRQQIDYHNRFVSTPRIVRREAYEQAQNRILEKDIAQKEAQLDFYGRQNEIQRSMFNPFEYEAQLQQQKEYEKSQRDYEIRRLQFQNQALDWKRGMMGRFGFSGLGGSGSSGSMGYREYSPQSRLAPTPMGGKPSWMNSYSTPKFPA